MKRSLLEVRIEGDFRGQGLATNLRCNRTKLELPRVQHNRIDGLRQGQIYRFFAGKCGRLQIWRQLQGVLLRTGDGKQALSDYGHRGKQEDDSEDKATGKTDWREQK